MSFLSNVRGMISFMFEKKINTRLKVLMMVIVVLFLSKLRLDPFHLVPVTALFFCLTSANAEASHSQAVFLYLFVNPLLTQYNYICG